MVCLLWWAYFDLYALIAARAFREAAGGAQARMARDSYALLHLPLTAGLALYALAQVAFRLRNVGTLAQPRIAAAAACLAVIPLAREAPSLVALSVLALIWAALIAWETLRYRDLRAEVRAAAD